MRSLPGVWFPAAVFAVWRGDFAEAERHHGIAAHVHEQTELYEAGSALMAGVALVREKGGPVPPEWPAVTASSQTGGHGMVEALGLTLLAKGRVARGAAMQIPSSMR